MCTNCRGEYQLQFLSPQMMPWKWQYFFIHPGERLGDKEPKRGLFSLFLLHKNWYNTKPVLRAPDLQATSLPNSCSAGERLPKRLPRISVCKGEHLPKCPWLLTELEKAWMLSRVSCWQDILRSWREEKLKNG